MEWATEISIDGRKISSDSRTYFIADIASNHDGDLQRAKDLIYQAADAGADAAKFQHFQAKTIVSDHGFKKLGAQLSHQSQWEKPVFEIYEDASLDLSWTPILKETCERAGIHFFTSPYAKNIIDEIDPFVPAFKIGSGDITYLQVVEQMALKNKPLLLATGASTLSEVNRAVSTILRHNNQIVLMQCNTNYTASRDNFHSINLNVLRTFGEKYPSMILGLSDHTPGHATVLGAIALGATVIEKHFTDDNSRAGPDHRFSMTLATWQTMVNRSRELESALGDGVKRVEENEKEPVVVQRRCLRLVRNLPAGTVIHAHDLESLRPAPPGSLEPYKLSEVTGTTLAVAKSQGDALLISDIESKS